MGFKNLNIRTKLITVFLSVGLLPLMVSNLVSYLNVDSELSRQAGETATFVAKQKANDVEAYFKASVETLVDLSDSPSVRAALEDFGRPFANPLPDNEATRIATAQQKRGVEKFYRETFAPAYREKTGGRDVSAEEIVGQLDPLAILAQYDYIANNPNPLGKKDLMTLPESRNPYSTAHAKYHEYLRAHLNRHGFYDLFILNLDGRIVYSVFKETDFGTSLRTGPWAKSNIAKGFEESIKLAPGEVYIADFETYSPSYEAPASFAATPIFVDGKAAGSLIIQIPLDKISAVIGKRDGLGQAGETLLVGADMKLRADTYRSKTTHNVAAFFAPDSKVSVESPAVRRAQAGESGVMTNTSYDGVETLAYFSPIKIHNLTWYIVTELPTTEVYAGLHNLTWILLGILGVCSILIAVFAWIFGARVANTLRSITTMLDESSAQVSSASTQTAASSTELSEAATEQAASLQETMASIEEISAMVSQNAESAQKANTAVEVNQKSSQEGTQSVDDMLRSIGEIKETNSEILSQMEASNKEFGEIVKIISEIGTKTNVINEIVFQTKLLSFNASVEAARAGEHGKGFAVVAEEVGNLAQMSGNAAKEITGMLSDSIGKVNGIVERTKDRVDHLVEIGKDKIAMGEATAQRCRDALGRMNENAKAVASMITEITLASKEQAQGVQEINKAISQLDQVTQQNSAVAQQSSTQAEHLNAEATALSKAVSDLVRFVDGQTRETNAQMNSVIPFKSEKRPQSKSPPQRGSNTVSSGRTNKLVAGSDVTPNNNDPRFEDF